MKRRKSSTSTARCAPLLERESAFCCIFAESRSTPAMSSAICSFTSSRTFFGTLSADGVLPSEAVGMVPSAASMAVGIESAAGIDQCEHLDTARGRQTNGQLGTLARGHDDKIRKNEVHTCHELPLSSHAVHKCNAMQTRKHTHTASSATLVLARFASR